MPPGSVNDFLSVAAGSRPCNDTADDDFDVARFSAIRKDQKDELERLEARYNSTQAAIESQVRVEVDQLFHHFQLGMQHLYTNLTKTVGTTIDSQVQLRLEQDQLRREHHAKKNEINARYHNEASKLIISTSHGARPTQPNSLAKLPSQSLVPGQGPISSQSLSPSQGHPLSQTSQGPIPGQVPTSNSTPRSSSFMATDSGHRMSPSSSSSVTRTQSHSKHVQPRALASDVTPRERMLQHPPRHEYMAQLPTPLPTPEELVPQQRRPVSSSPRHVEPRTIEPRPIEPRPVEPRSAEHRAIESRVVAGPVGPRSNGQRHTEERTVEQRPVEPRPAEQCSVEQRSTEQHPAEQPAEQRLVDQAHIQSIAAGAINSTLEPVNRPPPIVPSSSAVAPVSPLSNATLPRQEIKRKAIEHPTSQHITAVPTSKRPCTRDWPTEGDNEMQSAIKCSPRHTSQSLEAAGEPQITRTVTFQEIYQDGKAQFKHKIFMWPKNSGNWYIVRCDEHQVHFNIGNPKHGAAKHVHSPQHGGLEKKHDLAMQVCGHRVLGCNAEMAELNNREFQRALDEDNYQVFNMNLLTKEGKRRLTDRPAKALDTPKKVADTPAKIANTPAKVADAPATPAATASSNRSLPAKKKPPGLTETLGAVTRLEECKFYLGWWSPTKRYYMLILLPLRQDGSLREVGLKEKLQDTELMSNVPKCYSTDRLSLQIKGWQPAYADDGPKAAKRDYPVMFFDSLVQKHSVAWLSATKLKPVDLFHPPDEADKKQLAMAREWYATRMMHRKDWEQFKRLGPGKTPSPSTSESETGRSEPWVSLRSARTDEISPIRDKSSGPGHFFGSGSSDEGSDTDEAEDDPMTMDIGPIPEPADSNYVEEDSGFEDSDVEMKEVDQQKPEESDANNVIRPGRHKSISRPGSRHIHCYARETEADTGAAQEETNTNAEENAPRTNKAMGSHQTPAVEQSNGKLNEARSEPPTPPAEAMDQREITAVELEQDQRRRSAQAKAVAAMKEVANRSKASSEGPESMIASPTLSGQQSPQDGQIQARPMETLLPSSGHQNRARSVGIAACVGARVLTSAGVTQSNEARSPTDPTSILSKGQGNAKVGTAMEDYLDPYQRLAAIKAEKSRAAHSSRAASVPLHQGDRTTSQFSLLPDANPTKSQACNAVQQPTPNASQTMSPQLSQTSTMVPARSLSTTPTNGVESGRNTPKIVIPEASGMGRWKAVRTSSNTSLQEPCVSMGTRVGENGLDGQPAGSSIATAEQADTQLGTSIHEKEESFDVAHFYDSHGTSWARKGSAEPYLRLVTDPTRNWAKTASGSPLTANIEPAQFERILTDYPDGDRGKHRVQLSTKLGRKVMLLFETNAANGRSQAAALQGRKFVSWVKNINQDVEWMDDAEPSSHQENHLDELCVMVR